MLPAVELHFNYISRDKRRRCYILLDDEPQQALQVEITHKLTVPSPAHRLPSAVAFVL